MIIVTDENITDVMNMVCHKATIKDGVLIVETFETDKDLLKQMQRVHRKHNINLTFVILRRKANVNDNHKADANQ